MEMPCVVSQLTEGLSYEGRIDFRNTISDQRLQPENCVKEDRFYSYIAISAIMQNSAARLIIVLPNELKCRHDIHYIDF